VRHIIVDGYNVIRVDPRLAELERSSLEKAREVLVRTLASSPRLIDDRIVVVFDGRQGTRSHVHTQRMGRVLVMYSARGQIADDVIIEEARRLSVQGAVIVVTNDVHVRESCRAEGCQVSGSENLLQQMPGHVRPVPRTNEEEDYDPSLSTVKRGNPRRAPRGSRRSRDVRF
jgi:predicted RNA-binding protein with PIN domain